MTLAPGRSAPSAAATAALLALIYALPLRDVPLALAEPVAVRLFDLIALVIVAIGIFLLFDSSKRPLALPALLALALFAAYLCLSGVRGLPAEGQVFSGP